MKHSGSLAPLRIPAFRFLLAGRTINALGNSFAPLALAFAVLDLTGSATDLGLVVGARTLVNVVFLLFGGVLADRLPKHLLMVGASLAAFATQPARPNIFADLRTGWSEFRSRTWLWVVVAGFCVINASWSGALFVLGPVVADETIGRQSWGLVMAAQTLGMLAGALLAMRLRMRRMLLFGVFSTFFMALPVLILGTFPHLWLLIVGALVAGLMLEQFGIAWETTMQEHVPADKLARVYSYDMVGSFVAIPIGEMAVGPIAHAVGVNPTLVGATVLITLAVVGMLSSRDVRTLRHEVPEPEFGPVKESVA